MTVGKSDPNYAAALARSARRCRGQRHRPGDGSPTPPNTPACRRTGRAAGRLHEDADEAQQVTSWLVTGVDELKRLSDARRPALRRRSANCSPADKQARARSRTAGERRRAGRRRPRRLSAGATALAAGIARLTGGAEALEPSLGEGYRRSYPLQSRPARARPSASSRPASSLEPAGRPPAPHARPASSTPATSSSPRSTAPRRGCANAPREGDRPRQRRPGGDAARHLPLRASTRPARSPSTSSSTTTPRRSADEAGLDDRRRRRRRATLNDYSRVTRERIPLVVAAITLVTFLVLVLVLRALPLAAIAVGLNLATVGVAFGVLTLLFNVPDGWPLGGHTYVDAVGATMIFGDRLRALDRLRGLPADAGCASTTTASGDNAAAIAFGLEKTARVITGAAAIMMAVFIAFAGAPIATVSQLGVGLTVAVLLDATVVRIVLLPALMLLLGDRVWWLPRWLDRVTAAAQRLSAAIAWSNRRAR